MQTVVSPGIYNVPGPINPRVGQTVQNFAARFQSAKPFRHVVIDDFFDPLVAEAMLVQFPSAKDPSRLLNEFGGPNPKSAISDVRSIGEVYRMLDDYIQTPDFLTLMSRITGIPDLHYDPWYFGAGTHENFHSAGLDPHLDFNIHPKTAQHRRLNAIVYLNKDWDPGWRGSICLHSDPFDLKGDHVKEIQTPFNRCVIFETTEHSWHSVPPIRLPPGERHRSRKSFTIYLYTETRPADETAPNHSTVYVQPNLPKRIRAGRTLTEEDVSEIYANIDRRNRYLQNLYKREFRFSENIDRLKAHIRELERSSYVPLLGYAKIEDVRTPLFPDRFMGARLEFTMKTVVPCHAVGLFGYRPDPFEGTVDIVLSADGNKIERTVGSGDFSLAVNFPAPLTGSIEVAISATRTQRPPNSADERELSILVDRIQLTH